MVKDLYFIFANNCKFSITHGQATFIHALIFRNQKNAKISINMYPHILTPAVYLLELIQVLGKRPLIIIVKMKFLFCSEGRASNVFGRGIHGGTINPDSAKNPG